MIRRLLTTLRRLFSALFTPAPVHRAGHLKGQPVRESGADEPLGMGEPPPAVTAELALWRDALENVMGHVDTPIGRRKLGVSPDAEWLREARALLGPREPTAHVGIIPVTPRAKPRGISLFDDDERQP